MQLPEVPLVSEPAKGRILRRQAVTLKHLSVTGVEADVGLGRTR